MVLQRRHQEGVAHIRRGGEHQTKGGIEECKAATGGRLQRASHEHRSGRAAQAETVSRPCAQLYAHSE